MNETRVPQETSRNHTRPRHRGLTLAQMMKAVVFSAAVLACLAPVVRSGAQPNSVIPMLIFEAIFIIPLALACTGILVLRPGVFRTWFVSVSLLVPVLMAFVFSSIGLVVYLWIVQAWRRQTTGQVVGAALGMLWLEVLLGLALWFLGRFVFPRKCPGCGRRRLFRSGGAIGSAARRAQCVACGFESGRETILWWKDEEAMTRERPRRFSLEYWRDGDWLVGRLVEVPEAMSQGKTIEELRENVGDAYDLMYSQEEGEAQRTL